MHKYYLCFSLIFSIFLLPISNAQAINISNADATSGLKEALMRGTKAAVSQLGKPNGFLGDQDVKIELPEPIRKGEKVLRMFGAGKYADNLISTMNHAAESAVSEATPVFFDALKNMSFQDVQGILSGGENAATQYFKRTTSATLAEKFMPIVQKNTAKLDLASQYNLLADKASLLGLLDKKSANIDQYVTQKALDGLFLVVAEQEKSIRKDPIGTGSNIIKKIFGFF